MTPWRRPVHPMRSRFPFPIRPSPRDILPRLAPGMTYLMILENTSLSVEVGQSVKTVRLSKYQNRKGEEWSLEKYTYEKKEYYRIKNTFTGKYLAINPVTGQTVTYTITLVSSHEVRRSMRGSWRIVRNRNGSFSMINVQSNLSLSYSEKSRTKLTLRSFASLPSQHFYFYDCALCRLSLIHI